KEGIEAENIQVEAAHVMEAAGADQVEAGFGLIGKFLLPIENGLNIKFTAGIHTGCTKLLAPADSEIQSVADLRGKRIGVTGLAGAETIVTKRALAKEGISFAVENPEVEFLVFSSSDLGQALQNGAVDAIALGDPNASQFEREYGLNAIIDTAASEGFKDEYCCGAWVTEKVAQEHPEVAAAFTRAVLRASVWVDEHPEETAQLQIEKNYVAGDPAFNASVLSSYNYIPSVQGGYDAINLSVAQLTDIGVLKEGTVAKEFADGSYLFFDDVPDSYTSEEVAATLQD
ncbi:MAG: ABC transporter substrate-binding protein, partial [Blautia sp.]|nr:ABC transporter substrate-binding protein [Blautia sp.]